MLVNSNNQFTVFEIIYFPLRFIHIQKLIMKQNLNISQDTQVEDVFEDMMRQQLMGPEKMRKNVEEAMRHSMMARGADHEQIKEEESAWILGRQNITKPHQQHAQRIYEKQGVLLKESPNFFGGWEQRYCILKGQRFIYKQSEDMDSETAGILNFNLLSCDVNIQKKGNIYISFTIIIKNCDKNFVFKAPTTSQNAQWAELLKEAIHKSQGFTKNYNYLSTYPRFWRKDYESQSQFRTKAQTGDIMLFRGNKSTSTMQRAITMDQFDHIGIILLNGKGEALIFEANGGFGVGLCPWRRFVDKKWFRQYQLIVHRHLNIVRSQQFLQTVDSFVNRNIGKKYDFSLKEYLFNRNSTNEEEKEFFFCSSLVAKLFKRLQLLDQQKSSTQYLPSSFSNKGKLSLKEDGRFSKAFLQQQKIVVFQNLA